MLSVPDVCLPLLKEQRTCYTEHARQYSDELARTFDGFAPFLPHRVDSILDIGCGMAGIDVFLARRYPDAEIHLLDKQGVSETINAGYNGSADEFAHYHDFSAAMALLSANGVKNKIFCHDVRRDSFPNQEFDVVVSLLSWGFHYPIDTYAPKCRGVIVVDVRRETGGELRLAKHGDLTVIHESNKYCRVLVKCY